MEQVLVMRDSKTSEAVREILSGLVLDRPTLERVRDVFRGEIKLGLEFGLEKVTVTMY